MTCIPNKGDRIELVSMPEDPDPIPAGSRGTVDEVVPVNWPGRDFTQLWVTWDDGRSLIPCVPPDVVRVLSPRADADEAHRAFMSMPDSEWLGLLASLAGGGVLEPEEQKGFERAEQERRVSHG